MDINLMSIDELADNPKQILFAYQPIFKAGDGSLFGYEALMRPGKYPPMEFIEEMQRQDRLQLVEEITVFYGIRHFLETNLEGMLFLNTFPSVCMRLEMDKNTIGMGGHKMIGRLCFEILEYTSLDRFSYNIKRQAFAKNGANPWVAIDDFGTGGNFDLKCVDFYKPQLVKVDRSIISHIDTDTSHQETLAQICYEMSQRGIEVLAEGVETKEEYEYLLKQPIDYLQGYYLGRPKLYTDF